MSSAQTKIFIPHEIWKHIFTSTDFTLDDYITTIPVFSNSSKRLATQFVLATYNARDDSEEAFTGLLSLFRFEDGPQDCWLTLRRTRKFHRAVVDLIEIIDNAPWEEEGTKIQSERKKQVNNWIRDLVNSEVMKIDGTDRRFLEAMVEDNEERRSVATKKVIEELNIQAGRGNIAARDLLAICLLYGIGTEQNRKLAEQQMEISRQDYSKWTSRSPLSLACWCKNGLLTMVQKRLFWKRQSIEIAEMCVQFGMRARARATVEELLIPVNENIEIKLRIVQIFRRIESPIYDTVLDNAEAIARARPGFSYLLISLLNTLITVKKRDRALALLDATYFKNMNPLRRMTPNMDLVNLIKRLGDKNHAISVARAVLSQSRNLNEKVHAARVLVELGCIQTGRDVAEELLSNVQAEASLALPLIGLLRVVGEDKKARDVLLTAWLSEKEGKSEIFSRHPEAIFRQMHSLGMNAQMVGISFEHLPQTINLARGAYATGDITNATLILENVLKANPFSHSVKAQVAREFGKMGLHSRGISILNIEDGQLTDQNDIIAFAHAWVELGAINKAIELLNQVIQPHIGIALAHLKSAVNVLAALVDSNVIKLIDE